MIKKIIEYLEKYHIVYEQNVDLKKKTWIHRGGCASLYILPADSMQLALTARFLYDINCDFLLVGHTSNLYILNTTNIQVVVSTLKCSKFEIVDGCIKCEAGVGVIKMSHSMIEQGIKGFEYLTGLPGTIGAAICNNSSCKENSISQLLISADVMTPNGDMITMYPADFDFKFRTSVFKEGRVKGIILSALLKAEYADAIELKKLAVGNNEERRQLLEGHSKNLGCTVNRCWSLGQMPFLYRIQQGLMNVLLKLSHIDKDKSRKILKKQLFALAGYKEVEPYVSDKNPIVYMWLDDNADTQFERYLEFMEKVYKTKCLEIQIIR